MSWVKKGSVAAALAVCGLIALVLWLFLDSFLRWAFVRLGQAAAGAKVDISRVQSRLLSGRLELDRVAVADKHEPMKNLFQFDRAVFQMSPGALLERKAVVKDAEIDGIQVGTRRSTSGALPRSKPSRFEKAIEEQLRPVKTRALSTIGQVKTIKTQVLPQNLESLKALDAVQAQLSRMGRKSAERAGIPKIEQDLRQIRRQVSALEGGGAGDKAAAAARLQGQIKTTLSEVQAAHAQIQGQFASVQDGFSRAEQLRKQDVSSLLTQAGLPALNAQSLTRRLLGDQTAKRLSTALYWLKWLRAHEPVSQKAKAKVSPPRREGVDIEFPQRGTYPGFLIERLSLSGRLTSLIQGQDMDLEGAIVGITSNPPLYGKPTRLFLKGEVPGGASVLGLEGTLDETHEPASAILAFHYSGIPLAGSALGDSELGADVKAGLGRVNGSLQIDGGQLRGAITMQADGVALSPHTAAPGRAGQFALAALRGVRQFGAQIGISGTAEQPRLTIDSDLGKSLAGALSRGLSAQLASQRQAVEAKVDALYNAKAAPLRAQTSRLQAQLDAPLNKAQTQLQDALRRSAFESLQKQLPLKGLFH